MTTFRHSSTKIPDERGQRVHDEHVHPEHFDVVAPSFAGALCRDEWRLFDSAGRLQARDRRGP
jgi:hypothetical protein